MSLRQDQDVVRQVRLGDDLAAGQRMLRRQRGEEGLGEQRPAGEVRAVHLGRQQGGVQVMGAQPVEQRRGLVLPGLDLERGQRLAQRREHQRQQIGRQGRDDAKAETPGERVTLVARHGDHRLRLGHRVTGVADHPVQGCGRCDRLAAAFEQRHAKQLLQLADLNGKCRLADAAGSGRAAEMLMFGQGQQVAEIADIHR